MPASPPYRILICLLFLAVAISAAAESRRDPLDVTVAFRPDHVNPVEYFFVTLTVTIPDPRFDAGFPTAHPEFEGLRIAGSYDRRDSLPDGAIRLQRSYRLRPEPGASLYRMAPLAIEWRDTHPEADPSSGYQLVPGTRFKSPPLDDGDLPDVEGLQALPWFYERSRWPVVVLAAGFAILVAAWFLIPRRPRAPAVSPTPREEARIALDAVLALIATDGRRDTECYAKTASILRRFIERSYRLPSTGKTTSEYLEAMRNDARFDPGWVAAVAEVLEHADAVKYGGSRPDRDRARHAVGMARQCIETAAKKSGSSGISVGFLTGSGYNPQHE